MLGRSGPEFDNPLVRHPSLTADLTLTLVSTGNPCNSIEEARQVDLSKMTAAVLRKAVQSLNDANVPDAALIEWV